MTDVDGEPPDPWVEAALVRTRADLTAHAARVEQRVRDEPTLPPAVLAGLDRTLAAERRRPEDAGPPEAPEGPRPAAPEGPGVAPRRRWVAGAALAVAALVALVVLVVLVGVGVSPPSIPGAPTRPAPVASPPGTQDVPRLRGPDVAVAWRSGLGRAGYGPLADPARREGCLAALGVAPPAVPVGARPVVLDGRPAVLMVVTTGIAARFRVLVVAPECGPGAPLALADQIVGR